MRGKLFYLVNLKVYTENPVLNILVHTVFQIMRGMANIIDGLVLILSLGWIALGLGFKAVVFIERKKKRNKK